MGILGSLKKVHCILFCISVLKYGKLAKISDLAGNGPGSNPNSAMDKSFNFVVLQLFYLYKK